MMTTNFLICLSAFSGTILNIYFNMQSVKKCQCCPHIPRAVLTRSDATVVDSNF